VETIGKKMNLKGWEEFTLKYDDKGASIVMRNSASINSKNLGMTRLPLTTLDRRTMVDDWSIVDRARLDREGCRAVEEEILCERCQHRSL
jgi:hypothetical protein